MNIWQRNAWISLLFIAPLWLYFIAACIYAWLSATPERSISVNVMPMVIVGGIVVFLVVQSIATLIQYGRGGKDAEK